MHRRLPIRLSLPVIALLTAVAAALGFAPALAAPPVQPTYSLESLGKPLSDVLVLGGAVAPGPDGRPALWVTTGGKPSSLQAVDPLTGEVLAALPLQRSATDYAEGAYSVVAAPNGDVYVGSYYDGHLYRRKAGPSSTLEDLGQAVAGNQYVYQLSVDDKGVIYGGTYSGGALFSYDPVSDQFRNFGRMLADQMYVRSTAVGEGVVYAGTYDCHIVAVDPVTGVKRELPEPAPNCGHVSDMNYIDGRLYARTGNSIINATLRVYDPVKNSWVGEIDNIAGLNLVKGPDARLYAMRTDGSRGTLVAIDPDTLAVEPLGLQVAGRVANNRGVGWVDLNNPEWPGQTLVQMFWRGAIGLYNPQTGKSMILQSQVKGEPIGIWSLQSGAEDVYVGGYLNGGLGIHDRSTGTTTFNRFAQVESILEDGSNIWLGTYPDARKYVYDRAKVWSDPAYSPGPVGSQTNPALVDDGKDHQQVRAPAVTDLGDRVAFGTQGGTVLTGTVVVVDKTTREATTFEGPIADQGTYALTAREGVLYGGTSIYGGYAQPAPTTRSGHLYAMNPTTGEVLWQVVPKEGQPAVTGVTIDGQGQLWALTNGTVSVRNASDGSLVREIVLTDDRSTGNLRGDIAYDAKNGVIWALVQQRLLYRIDAKTGEVTQVLDQPLTRMTVHPSGDVYLAADAELLVLRVKQAETPTPTPSKDPSDEPSQTPSQTPSESTSSTPVSTTPVSTTPVSTTPVSTTPSRRPGLPDTGH